MISKDQYFLTNQTKIRYLISKAAISHRDILIELGAGSGSVALFYPPVKKMILVELDIDLYEKLLIKFPQAEIIKGDALQIISQRKFDVIFSNLPFYMTNDLLNNLKNISFKTLLLAAREGDDLIYFNKFYKIEKIMTLHGIDFNPCQPYKSIVYKIEKHYPIDHSV